MGTQTEFEFFSASGADVRIAGCWTGWTPEPMSRAGDERWVYTAPLPPGDSVQFKFVVDGEWVFASHYDNTDDGHGARNNTRCVADACEQLVPGAEEQVVVSTPPEAPPSDPVAEGEPEEEQAETEGALDGHSDDDAAVAKERKQYCPLDGVSELSCVSPDVGISPALAKLSVSTSHSSDTSKEGTKDGLKESATGNAQTASDGGTLSNIFSHCVPNTEVVESKAEQEEDFDVNDSTSTEEHVEESVQSKSEENLEGQLERPSSEVPQGEIGNTPKKPENKGCVIV